MYFQVGTSTLPLLFFVQPIPFTKIQGEDPHNTLNDSSNNLLYSTPGLLL